MEGGLVAWGELMPWEKPEVLTDPIDIERRLAWNKMQEIQRQATRPEDILAAFEIRSAFLKKYPFDLGMVQAGAYLISSWEDHGGVYEDIAEALGGKPKESQLQAA
jgi:hypothetical protein